MSYGGKLYDKLSPRHSCRTLCTLKRQRLAKRTNEGKRMRIKPASRDRQPCSGPWDAKCAGRGASTRIAGADGRGGSSLTFAVVIHFVRRVLHRTCCRDVSSQPSRGVTRLLPVLRRAPATGRAARRLPTLPLRSPVVLVTTAIIVRGVLIALFSEVLQRNVDIDSTTLSETILWNELTNRPFGVPLL